MNKNQLQMKIIPLLFYFQLIALTLFSQKIELIAKHGNTSFRGLSIAEDVIWVSGNGGTVGRSLNSGESWEWFTVKGFEKNDFRDIQAFDKNTAIIMAIASPAYILKTEDGGKNWKVVYQNKAPEMFLDAMDFSNRNEGFVIGDPSQGKIFVAETNNGGDSWQVSEKLHLPNTFEGEAFFAASGSNIFYANGKYYIVSGGTHSRIFSNGKAMKLPTSQGGKMTGANGLAVFGKTILVPGGKYENLKKTDSAFVYSTNNGRTWKLPKKMPGGYRSGICFTDKRTAFTCGINGVDITKNKGKTWNTISDEGFNTCAYDKKGNVVIFVGNNGRLGKLKL